MNNINENSGDLTQNSLKIIKMLLTPKFSMKLMLV